jgi:hypothetical protein
MTTPENPPVGEAPAAAPAKPGPYPTVQILQAAMSHRDSIRQSFESQRAALAEAIAAQKQAVTQAVTNAQNRTEAREGAAAGSAMPAADGVPAGGNALEKLAIAMSLLAVPDSADTDNQNAVAQKAVAIQQLYDALKALIAEEVARQLAQAWQRLG